MAPKDFIKKGSLLTLSAALLFNPTSQVLASEYQLNNSVQVYDQAENAKNRTNTVKTYPKGKYFIYKTHDGMINITKVEGKPGAWINPKDNLDASLELVQSSPVVLNSQRYTLVKDLNGYMDSDSALSGENPVITVPKGNYFVFRTYNGMINLTSVEGKPGAWVNPNENSLGQVESKSGKFVLGQEVDGYMDSYNAKDGVDAVTRVPAGEYFVFNRANGMVNITQTEGVAGVWINPKLDKTQIIKNSYVQTANNTVLKVEVENETITIKKATNVFELKSDVRGFANAQDALDQNNPITSLYSGKYYVYKTYNGMLNLSKNPDTPGSWVNPDAVKLVEVVSVNKVTLATESKEKAKEVETKEVETKEVETKEVVETVEEPLNETVAEPVNETVVEPVKETAQETKEEKVAETLVETLREEKVQETVVKTVEISPETQVETEIESKVETKEPSLEESLAETEDRLEVLDSTEAEALEEEIKNTENSIEYSIGDKFVLTETVDGYLRATDALLGQNVERKVVAGEYYIRKMELGMINITKELGHPGIWIVPR